MTGRLPNGNVCLKWQGGKTEVRRQKSEVSRGSMEQGAEGARSTEQEAGGREGDWSSVESECRGIRFWTQIIRIF
jgi:hypothetical protein